MKWKRILALMILVIAVVIKMGHIQENTVERGLVTKVIDGDTVVIDQQHKVRIIGINTPEIGKNSEVFGQEAKDFAVKVFYRQEVYLEKEVSETDRYGRLLRHIWLKNPKVGVPEEDLYGAMVLKEGFGQVATFPPDVKYEKLYRSLSRKSRTEEKGLWKIRPDGTTKGEIP